MHGELRVVKDVPAAYADLVASELAASTAQRFVLGCSGGTSGRAVLAAVAADTTISLGEVAIIFADERCVDPGSPDANLTTVRQALGPRAGELGGMYPMSCAAGPEAYEALLRTLGPIDCLQLGMGPDGHTASLFPGSPGLEAPPGQLVVRNVDPQGNNPFERLSLTFEAIAGARLVVITVTGADKAGALATIRAGGDLPAGRVEAERLIWLVEDGLLA